MPACKTIPATQHPLATTFIMKIRMGTPASNHFLSVQQRVSSVCLQPNLTRGRHHYLCYLEENFGKNEHFSRWPQSAEWWEVTPPPAAEHNINTWTGTDTGEESHNCPAGALLGLALALQSWPGSGEVCSAPALPWPPG